VDINCCLLFEVDIFLVALCCILVTVVYSNVIAFWCLMQNMSMWSCYFAVNVGFFSIGLCLRCVRFCMEEMKD